MVKTKEIIRPKITYIVTAPITADHLLKDQLKYMNTHFGEVTLICPDNDVTRKVVDRENIKFHHIPFSREISILNDINCLIRLIIILARIRPDIINYSTPKASLLASISSFFLRIPIRLYLLRGLRFETEVGVKGKILKTLEHLTSALSTKVVAISNSVLEKHVSLFPKSSHKIEVLGQGSSNGINLSALDIKKSTADSIRADLGIEKEDKVLGYVGRVNRDKGIEVLLEVFESLQKEYDNSRLHLVILGDLDGDPIYVDAVMKQFNDNKGIKYLGFVKNLVDYYQIMDVFVFPSFREGFGNVLIEASYCHLPIVAFDVTGVKNAVKNQETGVLVPFKNIELFKQKTLTYLNDSDLSALHGGQGAMWVKKNFDRDKVIERWKRFYESLLI